MGRSSTRFRRVHSEPFPCLTLLVCSTHRSVTTSPRCLCWSRLTGLRILSFYATLAWMVRTPSLEFIYWGQQERRSSYRSRCSCKPCVVLILLHGIWLAYISVESERPSRVFSVAGCVDEFLDNWWICLLVDVDSARTRRESQALSVFMAVVCCTFAFTSLICMGLPFHDENPQWGGGHCLSDHQGAADCSLLFFAGFRWQTASDSQEDLM